MVAGLPPISVFPVALDSDETLFLVHNTSEAALISNNPAWADEIEIEAVGADQLEQWADNGYANISGELFYYDSVEKNINGKVYKLKRCLRNLGGNKTKFNEAGTMVRGFVVAEHHNQLVDAVINIEKVAYELNAEALELLNVPSCPDDHSCPDVNFKFEISETDNCTGTLATFDVAITGTYTRYQLDFGDGTTTTDLSGTYQYAPNNKIDPVVTVENSKCQMILTPPTRSVPLPIGETPTATTSSFTVVLPDIPAVPDIIVPTVDCPDPTLKQPQIVFPCLEPISIPAFSFIIPAPSIAIYNDISVYNENFVYVDVSDIVVQVNNTIPSFITISGVIPSFITISGNVPSTISVDWGNVPSTISVDWGNVPSTISVDWGNVPSTISVDWGNVPSTISVINTIPSVIKFEDCCDIPSIIRFENCCDIPSIITFANLPSIPTEISMNWGSSTEWPVLSCTVTIVCPSALAQQQTFAANQQDSFYQEEPITAGLGIPSEIKIIAPDFPQLKIIHDIPTRISIEPLPIMPIISIIGPIKHIPDTIQIVGANIPETISIFADSIPKTIRLDSSDLPTAIRLEVPKDFPTTITLDASGVPATIQVVGIPESIKLIGTIPSEISVKLPENLEIPLVYKGGPIPITFDSNSLIGENEDMPCFAIIPCKK